MDENKKNKPLILPLKEMPLKSVPFHEDVEGIKRLSSPGFPLHIAVHKINNKKNNSIEKYVDTHNHPSPEINILLGDVEYEFILGEKKYMVKAPSSIWIPSNLDHSANWIKGKGKFICLILEEGYHAKK